MPYVFASIARFSALAAALFLRICTGCFPRCVTPAFAPGRPSRMVCGDAHEGELAVHDIVVACAAVPTCARGCAREPSDLTDTEGAQKQRTGRTGFKITVSTLVVCATARAQEDSTLSSTKTGLARFVYLAYPLRPRNKLQHPGTMAHLFFGYSGNVSRYHACVRLAASARLATIASSMGASRENARAPATSARPAYNAHSAA